MLEEERLHALRVGLGERSSVFWMALLLCLTDYGAILLAEAFSYLVRSGMEPIYKGGFFYIPPLYFFLIIPAVFMTFLYACRSYAQNILFWKTMRDVFYAVLYSILTIVVFLYFSKMLEGVSRFYVGMTGLSAFAFILAARYFVRGFLRARGLLLTPVLMVGAGRTAELLLRSFERDIGFGYRVVGFIDDHPVSQRIARTYPLLGGFSDAERVIRALKIRHVIVAAPGLPPQRLASLVVRLQPLVRSLAFVPDFIGMPMGNLSVESLFDEKLMLLRLGNNLASPANRALKRAFDLAATLCGLLFVLPAGLVLAVLIYLDSPGSVFFAHRRIGQGGREFPCYKFRTMVTDAEAALQRHLAAHPEARAEWARDFKLRDDPRVTRLGAFLRRSSLDELPQLLNVLKGEMSLVGPRPIVRAEIEKYGDAFQDFCLVPPGITGMWQVSGRSDTTYEERVAMDSWYVRNWSIWIDMVYLLKTVKVVLTGKGAY